MKYNFAIQCALADFECQLGWLVHPLTVMKWETWLGFAICEWQEKLETEKD